MIQEWESHTRKKNFLIADKTKTKLLENNSKDTFEGVKREFKWH